MIHPEHAYFLDMVYGLLEHILHALLLEHYAL